MTSSNSDRYHNTKKNEELEKERRKCMKHLDSLDLVIDQVPFAPPVNDRLVRTIS